MSLHIQQKCIEHSFLFFLLANKSSGTQVDKGKYLLRKEIYVFDLFLKTVSFNQIYFLFITIMIYGVLRILMSLYLNDTPENDIQ